ncbi:hypothetical protein [Thalassorhabdomicrobium marinisediminis]|uniref:hypothetical protein n=1 Tax=Thalassorhabdomicrobium marinisediminis TaxID=2170577 RepID=UPI0011B1F10C|nr:hypothetical protein [Thalassorhabdomicrobium marinisediminis]
MSNTRGNHKRIPHLELRPQGYVWRRRLPKSLCEIVEAVEFRSRRSTNTNDFCALRRFQIGLNPQVCFSLRTRAFPIAEGLARRLSNLSDKIFLYAITTMSHLPTTTQRLLNELVLFEIEAADYAHAVAGPRSLEAALAEQKREQAYHATLQQAYFLRDHSAAEHPLRVVAERLGIALPDASTPAARVLAQQAMRVLMNVSEERLRRGRGEFSQPSPYFARAVSREAMGEVELRPSDRQNIHLKFHCNRDRREGAKPTSISTCDRVEQPALSHPPLEAHTPSAEAHTPPVKTQASPVEDTPMQKLRTTLKERNLLNICSPKLLAALSKFDAIEAHEAFDAFIELKSAGCADDWEKPQKPDAEVGKQWKNSTGGTLNTSKKMWCNLLPAGPLIALQHDTVGEVINTIRRIPKLHGKGKKYDSTCYRALIEQVDVRSAKAMDAVERTMRRAGCTNEVAIEDARREKAEPRLRVGTFISRVRKANQVGRMLVGLGILPRNPFALCTFSNKEEARLRKTEERVTRQPWDDRFYEFTATPVFQGEASTEADPLFWLPLIAYTMGPRCEEIAQARAGDVQKDKDIWYLQIKQADGDHLKSERATRKIPIHPALIELGFLELARQAPTPTSRLFPTLTRGATKGKFAENFTKAFHYYREKHEVYWHGLDFHALRTSFHHHLQDVSTPGSHRRMLMGHEPLDEGERAYAQKGISIRSLYGWLRQVPFDASQVTSPIASVEASRVKNNNMLRVVAS